MTANPSLTADTYISPDIEYCWTRSETASERWPRTGDRWHRLSLGLPA